MISINFTFENNLQSARLKIYICIISEKQSKLKWNFKTKGFKLFSGVLRVPFQYCHLHATIKLRLQIIPSSKLIWRDSTRDICSCYTLLYELNSPNKPFHVSLSVTNKNTINFVEMQCCPFWYQHQEVKDNVKIFYLMGLFQGKGNTDESACWKGIPLGGFPDGSVGAHPAWNAGRRRIWLVGREDP